MCASPVVPFLGQAEIKILSFRPRTGDKATKAYCDVKIGPVTVFGMAVVWSDKRKTHFVSVPGRMGTKRFFPTIEIDDGLREKVFALVMAKFKETRA